MPPTSPLSKLALSLALVVLVFGLRSVSAQAKTKRSVQHGYERVWPTTVRFLRVDAGLKVVEKDADNGYVIFQMSDEGKTFPGTVEVIRTGGEGRHGVDIVMHIEGRPSYMEHALLDRLSQKIRKELGMPPSPKAPPKKEEKDGKNDEDGDKDSTKA